jgi:hypothetical protein
MAKYRDGWLRKGMGGEGEGLLDKQRDVWLS